VQGRYRRVSREFYFEGLKTNTDSIKSMEGIDIVWIEEAHNISKSSWNILYPTIRKPNSEIWLSFNPKLEDDFIYTMFIKEEHPDAMVIKIDYIDNPWLPDVLKQEIEHIKNTDMDLYNHVWRGEPEKHSQAQVFYDKWVVEDFNTDDLINSNNGVVFYYGMDFGYGADPTVLTRCFIIDNTLYIDEAHFWYHIDMKDLPDLIREVSPEAFDWIIYGDAADVASIRYLKNKGYDIRPSKKGAGSIKAGILYMRSFDKIVIQEGLDHLQEEFRLYKYKVDPTTEDVLPIIIDAYNHGIDSIRYGINKRIKLGKDNS